jgi:hypothetical protein
MGEDIFDKFNSTPPVEPTPTNDEPIINNDNNGTPPVTPDAEPPITPEPSAEPQDTFFETFNKRFNTQYKADDELKSVFEASKRIPQLEAEAKAKSDLEKSVNQYKQDLEELKRTEGSKYLSHPLMQKAYVAKQLLEKYPDKDPFLLQEIAMSDVDKMGDLDAVAKDRKIRYPSLKLDDIKAVILNELGVDATMKPEEWDSLAQSKLIMMGGDAKENIKRLTQGIELPKVETQEEINLKRTTELSKRTAEVAPIREQYSKFEKFKMGDGLEYSVPKEFQEKLPEVFNKFILEAGNDPNTEENKQILEDIRDSLFFSTYKKDIYEAMYKDAETKVKKALDTKLGNDEPPTNTSTASDALGGNTGLKSGIQDFKKDTQGERVRRLR